LAAGERIYELKRIRFLRGEPLLLLDAYFPFTVGRNLARLDLLRDLIVPALCRVLRSSVQAEYQQEAHWSSISTLRLAHRSLWLSGCTSTREEILPSSSARISAPRNDAVDSPVRGRPRRARCLPGAGAHRTAGQVPRPFTDVRAIGSRGGLGASGWLGP
jgi:hypothetical protein